MKFNNTSRCSGSAVRAALVVLSCWGVGANADTLELKTPGQFIPAGIISSDIGYRKGVVEEVKLEFADGTVLPMRAPGVSSRVWQAEIGANRLSDIKGRGENHAATLYVRSNFKEALEVTKTDVTIHVSPRSSTFMPPFTELSAQ